MYCSAPLAGSTDKAAADTQPAAQTGSTFGAAYGWCCVWGVLQSAAGFAVLLGHGKCSPGPRPAVCAMHAAPFLFQAPASIAEVGVGYEKLAVSVHSPTFNSTMLHCPHAAPFLFQALPRSV